MLIRSVPKAQTQFAALVNRAESGEAIRITRHGKPVAVLLSTAEYNKLHRRHENLTALSARTHKEAKTQGVALFEDAELEGLRDHSERRNEDIF
jgi:prevent-host-death family protein